MSVTETRPRHRVARGVHQTKVILEMIKFEHTVFMLPFALMAGRRRLAPRLADVRAQGPLDIAGDGRGALRRHGLQPDCGPAL